MRLNAPTDLKNWPLATWRAESRPTLSQWLDQNSSPRCKQQLKALGNIVVPDMARMAMCLMANAK